MSSSALAAGLRQLRRKLAAPQRRDDSDEQLLSAFMSRRDDNAFAVLVHRHGPMVLHVCRRVLGHEQDAEDAFQATFLVLARNVASLRNKGALASFLHGVAYRLARDAKRSAAHRRKHEGSVGALTQPRSPVEPADELSWREVQTLLDEEIVRLPEIYRSVFVLCCLENLSRAEAAQRLGLKECTLLSRLTKARKRLSQRLARRGVELTAALAATTLATPPASALPAGLMTTTIKAALATVAGDELAGIVSASVAELVQGATAAMMVSKAKIATVVLLAVSMLAGASAWAYHGLAAAMFPSSAPRAEPPAAKAEEKSKALSPKREAAKTVEIQGRVLGPDGRPKAGAKILLLGPLDPNEVRELLFENGKVRQLGVSAADGRFSVAVSKAKERMWHYLIAQCEGAGIDFFDTYDLKSGKPTEFRLVKDHAIRGRIVNTEGKPVAGVRVAVNQLCTYLNNSLDSFLVYWKNRPFNTRGRDSIKDIWSGADALLAATTDADGRFVLRGVGAERFLSLRLSGGGIAAEEVWVVNRAGFDPKPYNQATLDNIPKSERRSRPRWMVSGPDVSVIVEPEKVIRGVVTEADTGKGRPGVIVRLKGRTFDNRAMTDAQGRYEIHGGRKAKSYRIEVGSDATTGYLGCSVSAEDTLGYRPVTADIRVRKGVIVTGKMIDKATGRPLDGYVLIADLFDNPFVKEYSDGSDYSVLIWATDFRHTDANGVFRAVTIPGPVLLMGKPRNRVTYKNYIPDPKYPQYFEKEGEIYRYRGSGFTIVQGNFCKVLQIKPGVVEVKQDIVLERRTALGVVKIQDADGQPLVEADAWGAANQIESDTCTVYGDVADPPRLLIFYEAKRKLAGTLTLKAGEKLPPVVKLKPMGSIKGRLLDADGKPLAGIVVDPHYHERSANGIDSCIHEARPIASDANGTFILDSLIPDLPFELRFRSGRRTLAHETKSIEEAIHVKPDECRDVGAIKLK